MAKRLRVLVVEDSVDDAALLVLELRRGGYEPIYRRVETAAEMETALRGQPWDLVISDYSLPGFGGLEALTVLQRSGLDLPFIILSGAIGEETAVAAMKAGVHDYIMKGSLARLTPAIERELRDALGRRKRKQAEETIKHLAYYDPLTELPNRTLVQDRLRQGMLACRRERQGLALLLMDLDGFKEINDTLGHRCGDLVLRQVAQRLREPLRASDTVARLGGDEFAVVLPHATPDGAVLAAERLLEVLERPLTVEGHSLQIGASIGIAVFPVHGDDSDALFRRADIAMYSAKKNQAGYTIYNPEHDQHNADRLALLGDLHDAIENQQLVLHYQPLLAMRDGRLSGVEALVRWQHPGYGLIPPDQFIPLAEESGLIRPLSHWVLNAALGQYDVWRQAGLETTVAVNLSMRNVHDLALPDAVAALLAAWEVPAEAFKLEITETAFMANPGRAMEVMGRLRSTGVQISIDDFGTGYSSLAYLKRLPVHELKIDRSFVKDMAISENDFAIVRATIDLGHSLGLQVVAEGVEDQVTWGLLASLGCDRAQGYYMSPPLRPAELMGWHRDRVAQPRDERLHEDGSIHPTTVASWPGVGPMKPTPRVLVAAS